MIPLMLIGILIAVGSVLIGKMYGIFVGIGLVWFAFQFRESEDERIHPKKITRVKNIDTADELRAALGDIHSTPFGNVGQDVGYRTTTKFMENLRRGDFDDALDAAWALNHPHRRLKTNYSSEDVGMEYPVRPLSREEAEKIRKGSRRR